MFLCKLPNTGQVSMLKTTAIHVQQKIFGCLRFQVDKQNWLNFLVNKKIKNKKNKTLQKILIGNQY